MVINPDEFKEQIQPQEKTYEQIENEIECFIQNYRQLRGMVQSEKTRLQTKYIDLKADLESETTQIRTQLKQEANESMKMMRIKVEEHHQKTIDIMRLKEDELNTLIADRTLGLEREIVDLNKKKEEYQSQIGTLNLIVEL